MLGGNAKLNEVQLSDDLTTIETEIKSYQSIAGQSIFEIGRRLKHVKENDLVHGEFGKWLDNVNLNRTQAHKFIKIYEDKGLNVLSTKQSSIDALYYLSTIDIEERTIEHETSNGETKTPDEMTVKELRELKKQLKQHDEEKSQLESQLEQAKRSESIAQKQLEDEQDKEPEVVEHYMEPKDYQELKERSAELEKNNKELKSKLKSLETTPKVENQTFTDYRDEINAHTDAVEPEVKKAMQHETSAKAYMAAIDEIITITDDEVTDFELFERYIATMDYKLIGKAKDKIETLMKLGGYK